MAETTSRTLDLLNLLQTHRQWPGPELAERLGVTGRTLRRDIERLRELGYRVEAVRGASGGYRLEAGANLPPLLLSNDEAVMIAIGLRVAAAQGLEDGNLTTQTALAKFEQVLPSAVRERVNAVAASIRPESPRGLPVSGELLGQLALACRDHERIRFRYVAADRAETERVVEPHSLVAARRSWFLVCFDLQRSAWRTFRVDRLSQFFATRLHFEPRPLPAPDAVTFVETNAAGARQRYRAAVLLQLALPDMREHFGEWARDATAVDAHTTRWPISGDSVEGLLGSLFWVPAGVEFVLEADADVLAGAREFSARLAAAVAA